MAIPKSGKGSSNSFARQFLADNDVKIFRGEEQILAPVSPLYNIKLPNTRYFVGDIFVERKETIKVTVYSELRQMGWCIVSSAASENRFMRGQRVFYKLAKYDEDIKCVNNFPEGHFVEYDTSNKQIRLIGNKSGPLGYGEWINLEAVVVKKGARGPYSYKTYGDNSGDLIDNVHRKWMGMKEEPKPIYIKECAFMITDSNEIVCFPNTPDMPSILISGLKGTGKSYTMHAMLDRFFWKPAYDYKIVVLNDSSRETGTWSLPNDGEDAILELKRLNERPLPLPIVYLHPAVKEDYEKLYMGDVGFDITIPFREVIENNKEYLKIDSGSARYFSQLKNDLLAFKTEKQVKDFLETLEDEYGIPPPSAVKIRAEFDTLFDTKMTDISNEKQLPWGVSTSTKTFNPVTACVKAGALPVLETEYVSNQPKMLSIYFTYFVKDLFNRQKQDPEFVQEQSKVFLVIDECFTGDTLVNTSKGDIALEDIYQRKEEDLYIRTYNIQSRCIEYKPISNYFKSKDKRDLLEIETETGEILKVTPEQLIFDGEKYVPANKFKIGDKLMISTKKGKTYEEFYGSERAKEIKSKIAKSGNLIINEDIKQLVLSSFIGDGNVLIHPSKTSARIRFMGTKKDYIEFKNNIIDMEKRDIKSKINRGYKDGIIYQINTLSYKDVMTNFSEYQIKGIGWVLNQLNDLGIALWLFDDGSNHMGKGYVLHCNRFKEEDVDKIVTFFKNKGFDCHKRLEKKKDGRVFYAVYFNRNGLLKLIPILKKYVVPSMKYKVECNLKNKKQCLICKIDIPYNRYNNYCESHSQKDRIRLYKENLKNVNKNKIN